MALDELYLRLLEKELWRHADWGYQMYSLNKDIAPNLQISTKHTW